MIRRLLIRAWARESDLRAKAAVAQMLAELELAGLDMAKLRQRVWDRFGSRV